MLSAYFVQSLFLFDSSSSYLLFFGVLAFVSFLATRGGGEEREAAEHPDPCGAQRAIAPPQLRRASQRPSSGENRIPCGLAGSRRVSRCSSECSSRSCLPWCITQT
jgi:hypothetical protein